MVEKNKIATWEEGKTQYEGKVLSKKPKYTCYICGNEGFVPVGHGLHRCYRETCVYRHEKGIVDGELKKHVCYSCGRVSDIHDQIASYGSIPLYKCRNNAVCQNKIIFGKIKVIYTDQGVYKKDNIERKNQILSEEEKLKVHSEDNGCSCFNLCKKLQKDICWNPNYFYKLGKKCTLLDCHREIQVEEKESLVLLTSQELEELKKEELKERQKQLEDPKNKPTLIEFVILALQEKWYTQEELSVKFSANLGTIKSVVPTIVRKQNYNIISRYRGGKYPAPLEYKIEDFVQKQPSTDIEQKVTQESKLDKAKIPGDVGMEAQKDSPVVFVKSKLKLTTTQQRALNKLTNDWQNYKQLGEYKDVLNKLVFLGLAVVKEEDYKKFIG